MAVTRPTKEQLQAARSLVLSDVLSDDLDVLFCGIIAAKKVGEPPRLDIYARLHILVLAAEAAGEKTAVATIVDSATKPRPIVGKDGEVYEEQPDWRAAAWLLSRKYNKRWGAYAERSMSEEEDSVHGGEGKSVSAVDRLASVLDGMFGKKGPEPEDP